MGDSDGDTSNDLRHRNGQLFPTNTSAATLHDAYADSWRITDGYSNFTYPAGQGTSNFTDLAYPANIVTTGDFSAEQRAHATSICEQAGVAAGPSFDDCELDVLVTGNWAFAEAAAQVEIPSIAAGDVTADSAGQVAFDYETPVPNNFRALRVAIDPNVGRLAGPLSGAEQHRFYVPMLPNHHDVRVEFDAYAFGAWDAGDKVQVLVDDAVVVPTVDWSTAQTGQLATGVLYRKVRVSFTIDHHLSQVAVTTKATGLTAASGQGFGIDTIAVTTAPVPAQTFDVALNDTSSARLDAATGLAGAGVLENRGARDSYRFSAPANSELFLDWGTRVASIQWQLLDEQGVTVAGGRAGDGLVRIPGLGGAYALEISPIGATPPKRQTYQLTGLFTPAAQRFEVGVVSGSVMSISTGQPGAGAGVLETKASVDEYSFTVPTGGSRVLMDVISGTGWAGGHFGWEILDHTGTVMGREPATASKWFDRELPAGQYRLRVFSANENTGGYHLWLYTPPPDQVFTLPVTDTGPTPLRHDTTRPGSGKLETRLSKDIYTITVPTGRDLQVDSTSVHYNVPWRLLDPTGTEIATGTSNADKIVTGLPGGQYQLEFYVPPNTQWINQAYAVQLMLVPHPNLVQLGELGVVDISPGTPAPGAGTLETTLSVDEYVFTIPDGGSRVRMDILSGTGWTSAYLGWELLDSSGTILASEPRLASKWLDTTLPADQYRLRIKPSTTLDTGGYQARLYTPPPAQAFTLNLSDTPTPVVATTRPGAGTLETRLSTDRYILTIPTGRDLVIDSTSNSPHTQWHLTTPDGTPITEGRADTDETITALTAGTYHLNYTLNPDCTTTHTSYTTNLQLKPAA